jgi:hypothetical protein
MKRKLILFSCLGVGLFSISLHPASAQSISSPTSLAHSKTMKVSFSGERDWCREMRATLIMTLASDSPLATSPKVAADYLSRAVPAVIEGKQCKADNAAVAVMKDDKRIGVLVGKKPTWAFVKSNNPEKDFVSLDSIKPSQGSEVDLDEPPTQPSTNNPVRR